MKQQVSILLTLFAMSNGISQTIDNLHFGIPNVYSNSIITASVGEPNAHVISGGGIILVQGFCQPNIIDTSKVSARTVVTKTDFNIYPNPASTNLYISGLNPSVSNVLKVYNSQGKEVYSQPVIKTELITINISEFSDGIYFVQSPQTTKKLIINK